MKDRIRFYSILDFYPRKEIIKKEYSKLSIEEKYLFKKDVYSICFTKENVKDLIWEYLNDWDESYEKLEKEYNKKKQC